MSADIVAADQLKAIVQRVERLEAEIADLNADKSEIYKEARANGFDVKVIKKVVSKRKIDEHERIEQDHVFDLYWDAVHGLNLVHAHARENIEKIPASDGSPSVSSSLTTREAEESVVSHSPATARNEPEAAAEVAGDCLREPVAAEQDQNIREGDAPRETDRLGGDASRPDTQFQMDRATEGSFETGSEAAEKGRKATATVAAPAGLNHAGAGETPATYPGHTANQAEGGEHDVATGNAERVPTVTGEGAANTALPADGVVMEYVPPFPMKRLPFAHCFPELSKAEYERLEKDIAANRVREPIIRQGDVIVDGWARYNISRAYGMNYPIQEIDAGRDVLLDVIEWQRAARNFTPAQERKIAAELVKEFSSRADDIMAAFGLAEALEAAE